MERRRGNGVSQGRESGCFLFCRSEVEGSSSGNEADKGEIRRKVRMGEKIVSVRRDEYDGKGWYKLLVESGDKRWSVMLDEVLISWIQGVLQIAARKKWRFPGGA
ncbi:unnamed protein product [Linum trigynum]|uniref:Uncharacterized protein n=1 Tax=Linum trigynum TaxID=586398 RepID=A0AAV2DD19_9ROSI